MQEFGLLSVLSLRLLLHRMRLRACCLLAVYEVMLEGVLYQLSSGAVPEKQPVPARTVVVRMMVTVVVKMMAVVVRMVVVAMMVVQAPLLLVQLLPVLLFLSLVLSIQILVLMLIVL